VTKRELQRLSDLLLSFYESDAPETTLESISKVRHAVQEALGDS
jgi:hypothetical protein